MLANTTVVSFSLSRETMLEKNTCASNVRTDHLRRNVTFTHFNNKLKVPDICRFRIDELEDGLDIA